MNNLLIHRYQLKAYDGWNARSQNQIRHGVLLYASGGYADLFPWPEFGDADLETQLKLLAQDQPSDLAKQSLWLAQQDAENRKNKISSLENPTSLKNHFLMTNLEQKIPDQDFCSVKIKMDHNWSRQIHILNQFANENEIKIRLDFNATLDLKSFQDFYLQCSDQLKKNIEFVEDPFSYQYQDWAKANEKLPLACDFEFESVDWQMAKLPFSVLVLKPARQNVDQIVRLVQEHNLSLCVTSSMDHPVGCLHAFSQALQIKKNSTINILDCGCKSWTQYNEELFSKQIKTSGPLILGTEGYGIGFDQIFEKLKWEKI